MTMTSSPGTGGLSAIPPQAGHRLGPGRVLAAQHREVRIPARADQFDRAGRHLAGHIGEVFYHHRLETPAGHRLEIRVAFPRQRHMPVGDEGAAVADGEPGAGELAFGRRTLAFERQHRLAHGRDQRAAVGADDVAQHPPARGFPKPVGALEKHDRGHRSRDHPRAGLGAPLQIRQTFRVGRQPVPEFPAQRLEVARSQRLFPGTRQRSREALKLRGAPFDSLLKQTGQPVLLVGQGRDRGDRKNDANPEHERCFTHKAAETSGEKAQHAVCDRPAADSQIGQAVPQYVARPLANRPVLAVKEKPGHRPEFAKLYHVAMLELSGGDAIAVHPQRPPLGNFNFIGVFGAVKARDQVVRRLRRRRFRDPEEAVGPERHIQGRTAKPCHPAPGRGRSGVRGHQPAGVRQFDLPWPMTYFRQRGLDWRTRLTLSYVAVSGASYKARRWE